MNRLILLIISTMLFACSCVPTPDPEPEKEANNLDPGVFKFLLSDNSAKESWEAGDEILVHGGYLPEAIKITLKASDISSDGRTASVNLEEVPQDSFPPDGFYAAYPASLLDMEFSSWCYDIFHFKKVAPDMMCAWLSDDKTFRFQNVCGSITFNVDGDWDGCTLAGRKWEEVNCSEVEVELNSTSQLFIKQATETDYYQALPLKNGKATFLIPGGIYFAEGFCIYFKKGDEYPKRYVRDEALSLNNDSVLNLGNISSALTDYDGPDPVSPVMPVRKDYSSFVVSVPEISGLCFTADGSALWAVGDNGYLAQVSFDGQTTKFWSISGDMEGITIHPETGDLYIALEDGSQSVARVKAPDYKSSDYEILFKITPASGYGNSGLEGITYYKDNTLYIGSQTNANLFRYTLDGEQISVVSLKKVTPTIKEVGGLYYDPVTDWLWVTDSETHKLYVFDGEVTHLLATYLVPYISNNESVCVDHERGCVWVGNDEGTPRVFKVEFEGL